ncbi:MAG TPA: ABC transporter substrate-binding protein [Xanthobacteraceae bacterium]|nr:ABC transporter substrate-binding protein [Xanthobacteraceae bacterium]
MGLLAIGRYCRIGLAAAVLASLAFGTAEAEVPIRFVLGFKFDGPSAPFLVAIDKGYYKAEGLDVTIDPGAGAAEPISRIAAGNYDMGFGDINSLIKFRDRNAANAPTPIFIVFNRPPYSIVARKSRGITQPRDLEGKRLGAPAADPSFAQWKIFTAANNIDPAKVTIENVGMPVREPMLAAGQVDAITGPSFSSFLDLKDRGVPVDDLVLMLMADHGVDLYGSAIMVNPKFAAEKPEAVKAFLRAFVKGLRDTVRNPASAIDSVLKRSDSASRQVEVERLKMALRDNIVTPEVKENGVGGVDAERLARAIDQIALTYQFKTKPKPSDVFDFSFLPAESERRVK